jgi:polysaccharide chain length determinant protein (PEP-CTERM system associated)
MSIQLEDAQLLLNGALSRKDALLSQLNEVKQSKENWGVTDINQRLTEKDAIMDALLTRKKELLVRYTENHPEVVSINKVIESEKKKRLNEMDSVTKDNLVTPSVMANPYIQTIKVALNEAEAEVASQQSRVEQLKMRVERMKNELNSRLTVETDLQNLNRDYDAIKSNYEKLLESREQATMSEKVDDQAEALKFKIADAPNIPLKPSGPKRGIFYSGLLVFGFICGFGLSLLLYLIKPTVMSTLQLGQLTGLPVLGGVSMRSNADEEIKNKREMLRYYCGIAGIMLFYLGFMSTEFLGVNLANITSLLHRFY